MLDEPERKLLLKMADLEDALREEACLNSFISGYRLAQGILHLGQHIFQRMVVLFLIRHIYSRTAYRCLHWQML